MKIVVISCANYSDAWNPFVLLLRKFWPKCQYPVALITDRVEWPWLGDLTIQIGVDIGWAPLLREGLGKIDDDLVLLMQEDFFINGEVNAPLIDEAVDTMKRGVAECLRLMPCPGPDRNGNSRFGWIADDAPYRISCQAAIWKREYLREILRGKTSAASFEIDGTRERPFGQYMSVYRENPWPLPYLVSAIGRGEWNPDAITLCKKSGIKIDLSRRPVQGSK